MKLGKTKHFIFFAIALLIVAALYLGMRPAPVLVEVVEVKHAPLGITVSTEGVTRVKDRYQVSVPVSGFIRRLDYQVGDAVKQGEVLTELEPLRSDVLDARSRAAAEAQVAAANSALRAAQEQVEAAQADADFIRAEYERKLKLKATQFISEEELTQKEAEKRRAEAILRSAKFAVDVARYELDAAGTLLKYSAAEESSGVLKERVSIKSPVSGSILEITRKSEGVVGAGEPLFVIGDSAALEVAVDVLSIDAVKIKPGMPVVISRWGGDSLAAVVRTVEPVGFTKISALGVEEQRVWVIVDIVSPPELWLSLGDGYRVEAEFLLWQSEDVLQVPVSALFRDQQGWAVFVENEGLAEYHSVKVGQNNGLQAQVLEGLQQGQFVIVHPDEKLQDQSSVRRRH